MIYSINFLTISPDLRQSLIWVSKTHRDHFVRLEGVTRMTTPHTQRCTLLWVVLLIGFYKLSVWAAFQLPHHTPSGPGNILYRGWWMMEVTTPWNICSKTNHTLPLRDMIMTFLSQNLKYPFLYVRMCNRTRRSTLSEKLFFTYSQTVKTPQGCKWQKR